MNKSRLEWKVGLFVLICLVLGGALIMKFSKGTSVFTQTYELLLSTSNVGGIQPGASVLMAGVPVGTVESIELGESGRLVILRTEVLSRFRIHGDARFTIEQAGFLGDQYISVTPGANEKPLLEPGQTVTVEEPFNLQEVARSAAGLLRRVDETAARFNTAVERIDQTILSHGTLTNLSAAVSNFRIASERALASLQGIDDFVQTNTPPLTATVSNLVGFSEQLNLVTEELQLAVVTNRNEVTAAIHSLSSGSARFDRMLADVEAGKGLAGSLLRSPEVERAFGETLNNLSILTSNLSRNGLLWRPRVRRSSTDSVYPGRDPTR